MTEVSGGSFQVTMKQETLPGIEVVPRVRSRTSRRLLGAFYTPKSAADLMANWLLRENEECVLEPSFGDGIFLRAISTIAGQKGLDSARVVGVEIDEQVSARATGSGRIPAHDAHVGDFLSVVPFKVHGVIGNPPYVRLRHLPRDQRQRALDVARLVLGQPMDPAGSLWMPFVLHATRFLEVGGRLAFVLPYDLTYVRYARQLWQHLAKHFGSLTVLRTRERLFPDLLQDVVILLADGHGLSTRSVRYLAFESVAALLRSLPSVDEHIEIDALLTGERAFLRALIGSEARGLLDTRIRRITEPLRIQATFNIGYVSGDKQFFHPRKDVIRHFRIPPASLRPSITSARMMKHIGLHTSSLPYADADSLYVPDVRNLSKGDRRYIRSGESRAVHERYKCSIREPWFVVPGTKRPDVLVSVFSERPILLVNDAGYFSSNSLLCGYSHGASGEELATRWYSSLTLLQCELEVHALGGGVMVLVPREAGNIRVARSVRPNEENTRRVDKQLRLGKVEQAYEAGDEHVLIDQLGLSQGEVELIRHCSHVLSRWRTSARARRSV